MFYTIVAHGPYRIRQTCSPPWRWSTVTEARQIGKKTVLPARKMTAMKQSGARGTGAFIGR
jgi:hypothetical protein